MLKVNISGFYDEYNGSLDKQLELINKLGEKYLCPRNLDGRNIADFTAEEFIRDIKPRLDAAGVKFSSIGSPIGKVHVEDDEGYQKQLGQLKELVKIAEAMECDYIRIFSFFIKKGENPADYRDAVIEKMQGFLNAVEGSKVILLHENEKHIYGDTDDRCLDLYHTFNNEQFKLIYDASNYIQCDVDPVAAFHKVKDYTVYYHIKDCDRDSKIEYPVGLGDGKYRELFEELSQRNYQGFMTMEPHTMKYALLRKIVYFTPFVPFILKKYYNSFRKLDRLLGKKMIDKVSRQDVFLLQYENLKKLIGEVNNG
ncbi:MAG: sugar phosphate isomerase/epimerase [Clostridia bacterium]